MSSLRFADLAYPDVAALLESERRVVLLLPLGATEPHGPHAPLATDTLISLATCDRAAEALRDDAEVRALVLRALPYGVTRYGIAFPGAISVTEDTLGALVVDVCGSLAAHGFRRLVLVNNHFEPEQVATLRAVAEALRDTGRASVGYLDLTRRRNAERLTEEFRAGSCHAGRYETSLVLAEEPALVRRDRMEALASKMIDMPAAIAGGQTDFVAMGMEEAYCGAPAEASAEEGEQTFATLTEMLVEVVREIASAETSTSMGRAAC